MALHRSARAFSARRLIVAGLAAALTVAAAVGLTAAAGSHRPAEAAATIAAPVVYTYEVRGDGNRSNLATFAAEAAQTYADTRGWGLGGSIQFRPVAAGGDFTLWLAAASRLPAFGSPCDTEYSCTVGRNVIINETRWLSATSSWVAAHRSLRDYQHMVVNHETGHWLGFGHSFCGGAGQPAPVMQQQSISLQGCAANPWPLPAERQRLAASRGVSIRLGTPRGRLDVVSAALGAVRVRGWAIDPDTAAADRVHVYVDGRILSVLSANSARPDVGRAYPGTGNDHGFDATLRVAGGTHQICVFAINVAGAPASNPALGCRSVTVSHAPGGAVDRVTVLGGAAGTAATVQLLGWAIDPDTTAADRVHLYVDGQFRASVTAGGARPDVARAHLGYGPKHGFEARTSLAPGRHRVCVFAINIAGPAGGNPVLGCALIAVG